MLTLYQSRGSRVERLRKGVAENGGHLIRFASIGLIMDSIGSTW